MLSKPIRRVVEEPSPVYGEHVGVLAAEPVLRAVPVGFLEDDGLPRHVVAHAAVGGVAAADAGEGREAHRGHAAVGGDVGRCVQPGVVAVGLVELGDGLELAAVGHVVDEGAQDLHLLLIALCVL